MFTIRVRLLYIASGDICAGGPLTSHRQHLSSICVKKIASFSKVMERVGDPLRPMSPSFQGVVGRQPEFRRVTSWIPPSHDAQTISR